MSRTRVGTAALKLLVAVLAVGGCGVPDEEVPTRVNRAEVPFDLLGETSSARPAPQPDADAAPDPQAFFVTGDDQLPQCRWPRPLTPRCPAPWPLCPPDRTGPAAAEGWAPRSHPG